MVVKVILSCELTKLFRLFDCVKPTTVMQCTTYLNAIPLTRSIPNRLYCNLELQDEAKTNEKNGIFNLETDSRRAVSENLTVLFLSNCYAYGFKEQYF